MRLAVAFSILASCVFASAAFAENSFRAQGRLSCGARDLDVDRVTVSVGANARTIHVEFSSGVAGPYLVALDIDVYPNDGAINKNRIRAYRMHARCPQRDWYLDRELGPDPGQYDDIESLTINLWIGGRMAMRVVGKDARADDLSWLLEFDGIIE